MKWCSDCASPAFHSFCPSTPDKCLGCEILCGKCYHKPELGHSRERYEEVRKSCEDCGDEAVIKLKSTSREDEASPVHTCVEQKSCQRCSMMERIPELLQ